MLENVLECFLYHIELADIVHPAPIAQIVEKARSFNATAGITGLLAFDGKFFFHYVEGAPEQLKLHVESVADEPLFINFTPLAPPARIEQRRFANWSFAQLVVDGSSQGLSPQPGSLAASMQQLLSQKVH